jgi:hypothetical protein
MKKLVFIYFLFTICVFSHGQNKKIDSLINCLDQSIKDSKTFMKLRESRINNLIDLLKEPNISLEQKYNLNNQLFKEYKAYMLDTALLYLDRNLQIAESLNKDEWINETKFKLSHLLSAVGIYKESFDILETINRSHIPDYQKSDYYSCYEHIYSELSFYTPITKNKTTFREYSKLYKDTLLHFLNPESDEFLRIKELKLLEDGKIDESEKINTLLLSKVNEGTPEYALLTYRRAIINRTKGNGELFKKYLILSAISDVKAAIKDNASLHYWHCIYLKIMKLIELMNI